MLDIFFPRAKPCTGPALWQASRPDGMGRLIVRGDSVVAFRGVFLSLIQKHFPSAKRKRERGAGSKRKRECLPTSGLWLVALLGLPPVLAGHH